MAGSESQQPSPGDIVWTERGSWNAKAVADHFAALMGYTIESMPVPGGEGEYRTAKNGDKVVCGFYQMTKPDMEGLPEHWMSYIGVEDVDATVAKNERLGGETRRPPFDIPTVGRIAVIADPQGAVIGLLQGA